MDDEAAAKIKNNRSTWNTVSDLFLESSALPVWAPFGVGDDLNLIPEIKGKTFLEIGCGSGRSIKYLTDRDAKMVYGLDVADAQVRESTAFNQAAINEYRVEIIQAPMEQKVNIEPVDYVFSIYGFGWTQDPDVTLQHIYSYLKPGGRFIWSWDHSFATDVQYRDGQLVVEYSYHDEHSIKNKDWRKTGCVAHITYRKISTWFKLQRAAGFNIIGYYEPVPKNLNHAHDDPTKHYSIQKAEKVPITFIFVCQKPGQ
jgi:SAM-dependent methyltransferase